MQTDSQPGTLHIISLLYLSHLQLMYYLEKVNFTTPIGDQVSFDENGDALPIYDVMNWLQLPDGRTKVQNVGEVKKSVSKGEELTIDEDKIFWNFELQEVASYQCCICLSITCNSSIKCCR